MKNTILFFLIILTGCMDNSVQSQPFSGNFAGQQPGINSAAAIKVNGNVITGSFELNGRPGNIEATVQGDHCQGTLYDIQMQKNYAFTGYARQDSLYMDIVFPELNNQVIRLQMKRIPGRSETADSDDRGPGREKAAALIGLWRYTETFSSGSGDNYASFSTDYFMEFKVDGTIYSWTGKSAGGSGNITLEGYPSGTQKGRWYTEGKTLYLTDIAGGQKNTVLFYAEANRMMLHNGGSEKKILTRIR